MATSKELIASLENPATSFWLKRAVSESMERDPVDALRDASILVEILEKHLNEVEKSGLEMLDLRQK